MTYDSTIPNQESNPNNSEPAEANLTVFGEEINPILPNAEIDSVLHFISSPIADNEKPEKPHFISSSVMSKNNSVNGLSVDNLNSNSLNSNFLNLDNVTTNSLPLENADILVESHTPIAVSTPFIFAESQKTESPETKYQQIGLPPANLEAILQGSHSMNAPNNISPQTIPDNTSVQLNTEQKPNTLAGNAVLLKNNVRYIVSVPSTETETEKSDSVSNISNNPQINNPQIPAGNHITQTILPEEQKTIETSEKSLEKTSEKTLEKTIPLAEQKNSETSLDKTNDEIKATDADGNITTLSSLDELDTIDLNAPVEPGTTSKFLQVQLKSEAERLVIILPSETQLSISEYSWSEIWQQLKQRLNGGDRFRVANTNVHLVAGDRLLDVRQLQELAESLNEVNLQLKSVATSRRQTAIAAVTTGYSVEQTQLQPKISLTSESSATATPMAEPLYIQMTIRSGVEIRHPGTVIILGDVNPGGIVVADGDILVWGRLRGVAHAGAGGNHECLIMSVQMEPTQLRIADAVARAPEKTPKQHHPEVAYIATEGIRIAKATDFSKLNRGN
jgi:septum site-determining protein MinC